MYGKMGSPVTSKFNLSIGGFVKLDYAYNSVNFGRSGSLAPGTGVIPKAGSTNGNQEQSIFTARQSRLWFKVLGPALVGAKTSALIEVDFYGDASAAAESPQVRMRQAWGSIDWANTGVLFGQGYDIFGPMVANTIDFRQGAAYGTPNNPRVPQLRLTQKVDLDTANALKLIIGVQDPNQNANNNSVDSGGFGSSVNVAGQAMWVSKALGVAPGFYGLSMNSLSAGFFGLYGSQKTSTTLGDKSVDSWGYGFYTFVPVMKSKDGKSRAMTMSLEAQAFMAANMAFNSATAGTYVGAATDPKPAKGYGFAGQVIFYPTQNLGVSAGYLRRNAYNYNDYRNVNNFQEYSSNIFANVSYDLNAAIRVAAEYEYLNTHYGNSTIDTTSVQRSSLNSASGSGSANVARLALYYFF
jgi:hypothetical protein